MRDTFIDDLLLNVGWNINDQRCSDAIMSSRLDYAAFMERHCPFCDPTRLTVIWENESVRAMLDGFPVTEGHLLFVPTQESHVNLMACYKAAYQWGINGISANKWDGFNVGQNVGSAAGQTIMYPHVHMIPRRTDDMPDPRGGVRHVIPSQGNYKNENYKLVS